MTHISRYCKSFINSYAVLILVLSLLTLNYFYKRELNVDLRSLVVKQNKRSLGLARWPSMKQKNKFDTFSSFKERLIQVETENQKLNLKLKFNKANSKSTPKVPEFYKNLTTIEIIQSEVTNAISTEPSLTPKLSTNHSETPTSSIASIPPLVDENFHFENPSDSPNPSKVHFNILKSIEYLLKQPSNFFTNYHNFTNQQICHNKLLIMVAGAPKNVERRDIIRKYWSKFTENFASVIFTVGIAGLSQEEISSLHQENVEHQDLLMLDYAETYDLLTVKTIAQMVFYYQICQSSFGSEEIKRSKFMLHIDDDLYLNLPTLKSNLLEKTGNMKNPDRIYCLDKSLMKSDGLGTFPHRKGKYMITDREFSSERFPTACAGTAFLFSYQLNSQLVKAIPESMPIRLEDIYTTGILRQIAEIPNPIAVKPKLMEHLRNNFQMFEQKISSMDES